MCEIPKYVQAKNRLAHLDCGFMGVGYQACRAGWYGEYRLTRSISSEIFLQKKFMILQGRPIKKAVFLPGKPAPYNQLLIQPLLLVPDCYCV